MPKDDRTLIQEALEAHERAIRVTDDQNAEAKRLIRRMTSELRDQLSGTCIEIFVTGSYRRKTQIAPLEDVDMIVVLALGPELPASEALALMAATAARCPSVETVEVGVRAVTCVLRDSEITMDLVPAREQPGTESLWLCCYKPADNLDEWTLEPPRQQIAAAIKKQQQCDGDYIPVVRIAKHVNRIQPRDADGKKPVPSYSVEASAHSGMQGPTDWILGLLEALQVLEKCVCERQPLPDPGSPDKDVLALYDESRRQRAASTIRRLRQQVAMAAALPAEQALELLRELLGDTVPTPTNHPDRIRDGIRRGKVGGAGAGIAVVPASAAAKTLPSWRP
jgi:hypothetical protein